MTNKTVTVLKIVQLLSNSETGYTMTELAIKYKTSFRSMKRYIHDIRASGMPLVDLRDLSEMPPVDSRYRILNFMEK